MGRAIRHSVTVPAKSRRTVEARAVADLAPAEFTTTIEADGVLVADRLLEELVSIAAFQH